MTEEKTRALITMTPGGALTPGNFEGLWRLSEIMAASGMMPKNIERPETVFVAVQMGLEVGLSPMQAVQNIAVVNGRPTIWGDAMLGLVRGSGLLAAISEVTTGEGDATAAVCTVTRRDDPGETVGRFSVADAKRAGLWGKAGPWTQYPRRMLQMRARGYALRDKFSDVLKGLYAREEIEQEQYMGKAEVLSSTDLLREINADTRSQDAAATYGADTTQAKSREAAEKALDSLQGPASAEWPKDYHGNLYDSRGVVWDGVIHSGQKTCNSDGTWRRRKGVHPDSVLAAEARYPRIDPLTAFGSGPAVESGPEPLDLAQSDLPTFSDALTWIETAQDMDALNSAMDAARSIDMDHSGREALDAAAAAQASLIRESERHE